MLRKMGSFFIVLGVVLAAFGGWNYISFGEKPCTVALCAIPTTRHSLTRAVSLYPALCRYQACAMTSLRLSC